MTETLKFGYNVEEIHEACRKTRHSGSFIAYRRALRQSEGRFWFESFTLGSLRRILAPGRIYWSDTQSRLQFVARRWQCRAMDLGNVQSTSMSTGGGFFFVYTLVEDTRLFIYCEVTLFLLPMLTSSRDVLGQKTRVYPPVKFTFSFFHLLPS